MNLLSSCVSTAVVLTQRFRTNARFLFTVKKFWPKKYAWKIAKLMRITMVNPFFRLGTLIGIFPRLDLDKRVKLFVLTHRLGVLNVIQLATPARVPWEGFRNQKLKKLSVHGDSLSIISESSDGYAREVPYSEMDIEEDDSERGQGDVQGSGSGPIQDPVVIKDIQEFVRTEIQSAISKFAQILCNQIAKSNYAESEAIVELIKLAGDQFNQSLGSVVVSHD